MWPLYRAYAKVRDQQRNANLKRVPHSSRSTYSSVVCLWLFTDVFLRL